MMSRQRGRMGCFQHMMFVWIHIFGFSLSWFTPEQKRGSFAVFVNDIDDLSSKLLPSTFCVRIGFAILDRQTCV